MSSHIRATVILTEDLSRDDLVQFLSEAVGEEAAALAEKIFNIPAKTDLKRVFRRLRKLYNAWHESPAYIETEDEFISDGDAAAEFQGTIQAIMQHGQGITTHDMFRLELLSEFLYELVDGPRSKAFMKAINKWEQVLLKEDA